MTLNKAGLSWSIPWMRQPPTSRTTRLTRRVTRRSSNPLIAYEIGEHGDPTRVVLRLAREGEVDFLMNDRTDEEGPKQALD